MAGGVDPNDVRKSGHLNGTQPVDGRSVADLAKLVVAPCPHCAVRLERQFVLQTRSDLHSPGQPGHDGRGEAVRCRPVAELSSRVSTPRVNVAVSSNRGTASDL